jgi:REP element-mobilizing transposase RayT
MPQHVTQRGNRGQPTLFCEEDDGADVELLAEWCRQRGVEGWAYCRMPNHGHGIAVPQSENRLRLAMGEAHRRYPRRVSFRHWAAHAWVHARKTARKGLWIVWANGRELKRLRRLRARSERGIMSYPASWTTPQPRTDKKASKDERQKPM